MNNSTKESKLASAFSRTALVLYVLVFIALIAIMVFDFIDAIPIEFIFLVVYSFYIIGILIRVRIIRKRQSKMGIKPIDLSLYEGNEGIVLEIAKALEKWRRHKKIVAQLLSKGIDKKTAEAFVGQVSINPQLIKNRMARGAKYLGVLYLLIASVSLTLVGEPSAMFDGLFSVVTVFYYVTGLVLYFSGQMMYTKIMG